MLEGLASATLSRRALMCGALGAAAVVAVGAGASLAGASEVVRPPGALNTAQVTSACIRCDRCRGACPQGVIVWAPPEDGLLGMRTPKLDFRRGFCDFCQAKEEPGAMPRCVANCPTAALAALPWDEVRLGVAVVDPEECIAYNNFGGCTVCVDACGYEAISLSEEGHPVVDEQKCNGCGQCEYECPSHTYRAFSGAAHRGIFVVPPQA